LNLNSGERVLGLVSVYVLGLAINEKSP